MSEELRKPLKEIFKKLDDFCVGTQKALSEASAYLEEIQDEFYCIEENEEEQISFLYEGSLKEHLDIQSNELVKEKKRY